MYKKAVRNRNTNTTEKVRFNFNTASCNRCTHPKIIFVCFFFLLFGAVLSPIWINISFTCFNLYSNFCCCRRIVQWCILCYVNFNNFHSQCKSIFNTTTHLFSSIFKKFQLFFVGPIFSWKTYFIFIVAAVEIKKIFVTFCFA